MYKLHLGMDLQSELFNHLDDEIYAYSDNQNFSWSHTMKRSARLGMEKKEAKAKANAKRP